MSFFQRLGALFGGRPAGQDDRFLTVYLLSHRCREPITGQVDLLNELSADDGEHAFYARKVFHGSGARRCFDQVEVELWFDGKKTLAAHEVIGGRWLDAETYAQELHHWNAPPAEPVAGTEG